MKFSVGQLVRLPHWFGSASVGWIAKEAGESGCYWWVLLPLEVQVLAYSKWKYFCVPGPALWHKQFSLGCFHKNDLKSVGEQGITL